jgi:GAF domain-containing protein
LGTRPLLIRDIAAEKHLISQVPQKEKFRTKSLLSVPLVAQGEVIGVINVNNRKDGLPFSESDKDLLCKIGSEIAAVLQRSYMALQMKKAKELDRDIKRFMV